MGLEGVLWKGILLFRGIPGILGTKIHSDKFTDLAILPIFGKITSGKLTSGKFTSGKITYIHITNNQDNAHAA